MAAKVIAQQKLPLAADVQIGTRIKQRRTLLNMSQTTLGNAIGVTFQQVQKYERGMNRVGGSRMAQIATVLNCPVHYFFEGVESGPTNDVPQPAMPQLDRASIAMLHAYQKLPSRLQTKICELVASIAKQTDNDVDEAA